jgi:two-component system nitrate/nitrite sensor histidine kinase NarX
MHSRFSLSTKLVTTGSVLLAVALLSIGLTLWVTWQLEGGAAAVNEAGRMRMQIWRLNSTAQSQHSAKAVSDLVNEFSSSIALLKAGDPERPLFMPQNADVNQRFQNVQFQWLKNRNIWIGPTPPDVDVALLATAETVAAVDALVTAIEQQLSRLTAILNLFQFLMMALAIGGAVVMLYTGYLYVINPLLQLQGGLQTIESGDFTTRIEVETEDEFGQVASGFNVMAAKLQSMYDGLETQVKLKTERIESQRARIETLYEISGFLAASNTIQAMTSGFAQRVRETMSADAVVIRWFDEENHRYLMLASDCFSEQMAEEERSILAGACACGSLQSTVRTRVIPIANHLDTPVRRCAKVGYENVVSVPVRLQNRMIGEINLFFRSEIHLSADEIELLDALANHLASAMEGLRADALERETAVSEERAMLARELHDSIAQSLAFLKIQVQILRSASQQGMVLQIETALDELDAGLKESISDVRELLVHFRTRANSENIEVALQETFQKFKHQTGLPTQLHIHGDGLPLPADVQIQVLHVIQEALSNVRKHANASAVKLDVQKGPCWTFVVCDDGVGFTTLPSNSEAHVGLKIMRERAAQIGAQVVVTSSIEYGTSVKLILPEHPVSAIAQPQPRRQSTSDFNT